MAMNKSDQLNLIVNLLIISLTSFLLLFSWLFSKITEKQKEKTFRLIFLSSPIWLTLSILQLLIRLPSILNNQFDPFLDFFTLLAFFILSCSYFLIANWPATFAYTIITALRQLFPKKRIETKTFWTLLDNIRINRYLTLFVLFLILLFLIIVDSLLLLEVSKTYLETGRLTAILVILGFGSLTFYLTEELLRYGQVEIPRAEHKKTIEIKKAIEKLSIAAGIKQPDFEILSHNNPNAFSVSPNFAGSKIYLTSALLNLADNDELEAAIGHQIAHILSGRVLDHQRINNLLTFLRVSSFIFFLLILTSINPMLIAFWLAIVFYSSIQSNLETTEWRGDASSCFNTIITITNPPFAFLNFFSHLIYYTFTFNEIFYADLKTIQLTRYPKKLYSILTKLEEYQGFLDNLPENFYQLYFVGEKVNFRQTPMPQPPITLRKSVLEEIDYTLHNFIVAKESTNLKCPSCKTAMVELKSKGHYGELVKIDRCPKCGSVWFDNLELWYIADLTTIASTLTKLNQIVFTTGERLKLSDQFLCPRCGVDLFFISDPNIPPNIQIWKCRSCKGNWLERRELLEYSSYKNLITTNKNLP